MLDVSYLQCQQLRSGIYFCLSLPPQKKSFAQMCNSNGNILMNHEVLRRPIFTQTHSNWQHKLKILTTKEAQGCIHSACVCIFLFIFRIISIFISIFIYTHIAGCWQSMVIYMGYKTLQWSVMLKSTKITRHINYKTNTIWWFAVIAYMRPTKQ